MKAQWDRLFLLSFSAELCYREHFFTVCIIFYKKREKSGKDKEESSGNSVVVNIYNHCVPPSREFIIQQKGLLLNVFFSARGIMKMETIYKFTLDPLIGSLWKVCVMTYRHIQVHTLEVCFLVSLDSVPCNAAPPVCIPAQTSCPRSHMRCTCTLPCNAPRIWLQSQKQCSHINAIALSSCQPVGYLKI